MRQRYLPARFPRSFTYLAVSNYINVISKQISHGGSQGFKSPHLHPTDDQRKRWSSLCSVSRGATARRMRTPYYLAVPAMGTALLLKDFGSSVQRDGGRHPLWQNVAGCDESARDRRLRRPGCVLDDTAADRLKPGLVAAGGKLGEHPLQCELVQQLGAANACQVGRGNPAAPSTVRTGDR